jgi:hypothetical protein
MLFPPEGGDRVSSALADASGNFRIADVVPGAYTIRPNRRVRRSTWLRSGWATAT